MNTIIEDDLISIISNGSFELLDDDENTIIIDGVEINKNEYLKTLHILQNISNKKKEKEDEIKSIDKLNEYKNKLMELYIELYLYDNIEYLLNEKNIKSTYHNDIFNTFPHIFEENKINVIIEFKNSIIKKQMSKLILDIEQIKTDIYTLINKNYNILKNNIKKIGLITQDKFYSENNDILNNIKFKLFNILFQCIIQIEKKRLEIIKNNNINRYDSDYDRCINFEINRIKQYEEILLNNDSDYEKIVEILCRDYSYTHNNYSKYKISNNILNKEIIFNSIKYYYKDIEEIYDSVKKEYETKSIIEELNNYKEQNKLLNEELNNYKEQNKLLNEELNNIKIILLKNNIK